MGRWGRITTCLLISTVAGGCAGYDAIATKGGPICNSLEPVTISRRDVLTDGTKKSIAGTNAVVVEWCGERPVAKEPEQKVASAR